MPSVNYQTYKNLVKQNWVDGGIDQSKVGMLSNLRKTLGVSDEEHAQIVSELGASSPAPAGGAADAPATPAPDTSADTPAASGEPGSVTPVRVLGAAPNGTAAAPGTGDDQPSTGANGPPLALPAQGTPDSGRYLRDMDFSDQSYSSQDQDTGTSAPDSGIKRVSPAPAGPTRDTGGAPAQAAGGDDSPEKLLEKGKEAFRNGEYQLAYDLCDQVLKLKPNNSQATFFKKRAKTKLDEAGGGAEEKTQAEEAADPMMAHSQTAAAAPAAAGSANPKCLSCRDTEVCSWCKGTGVCWMCHGGSKCSACKGTGIIDGTTCNKCKGKGDCDSCLGSGKCYWCKGSGKCHKCQR